MKSSAVRKLQKRPSTGSELTAIFLEILISALFHWWKAFKSRHFMRVLDPWNLFRKLYAHLGSIFFRGVERGGLHIDHAG